MSLVSVLNIDAVITYGKGFLNWQEDVVYDIADKLSELGHVIHDGIWVERWALDEIIPANEIRKITANITSHLVNHNFKSWGVLTETYSRINY